MLHHIDAATGERPLRGWLFFRHTTKPELWCAVIHGRCIADFLLAGAWKLSSNEVAARSIGPFRHAQALQSMELNGFYLFQALPLGPDRPNQTVVEILETVSDQPRMPACPVSAQASKAA